MPMAMNALPPEIMAKAEAEQAGVTVQDILATVDAYRAGVAGPWIENAKAWLMVQGFSLFLIPVSIPLMMLGLGLFKSGFLSGRSPVWVYLLLAAAAAANLWILTIERRAPCTARTSGVIRSSEPAARPTTCVSTRHPSIATTAAAVCKHETRRVKGTGMDCSSR